MVGQTRSRQRRRLAGANLSVLTTRSVRRILASRDPVDMRKSFDGLIAIVRNTLLEDPLSGNLFVFVNRRGN